MLKKDSSAYRKQVLTDRLIPFPRTITESSPRHQNASGECSSHLSEESGTCSVRPRSAYELSWNYAQDGKLAVDLAHATVVDANPAFEAMIGYSREELIGMHVTQLHPEDEHELVRIELSKDASQAALHIGFHILRKDGGLVPVQVWSS